MQLINSQNTKMDKNKMIDLLRKENQFISFLLEAFEVPEKKDDEKLVEYLLDSTSKGPVMKPLKKPADTPEDLQDRMDVMKNKIIVKHLQRSASKKPSDVKTERKKLKKDKEMKKKLHKITKDAQRNEKMKQERANNAVDNKKNVELKENKDSQKPIFNVDSKIVFSKIDFAESEKKKKGLDTNPKNLLAKIKKQKEDLKELKESGDKEKYAKVKNEIAWKKAFDKTLGNKIRDDPQLLLKKIKKRKNEKIKAKKTWKERAQKIEHDKDSRQKKRNENLKKRVDDKKKKKYKKLESRGRIVPGF